MRLLPFLLLAGFSAAKDEEPEISALQIHFRDDLFEGIKKEGDNRIAFILSFEHEYGLEASVPYGGIVTHFYNDWTQYGCEGVDDFPQNTIEFDAPIHAPEAPGVEQAYDPISHDLYSVRVKLNLSSMPQSRLCIRLGLWDYEQMMSLSHMDMGMTFNVTDGVYFGKFSTGLSLDPASSFKEQSGELTEEVLVDAFLCGIPNEDGATGLGTPSHPDGGFYKIGEEFRICVQPSEEKAMEYYVDYFKNVFCEIGTRGGENYKRTLFDEYGTSTVLTSSVTAWGSASSYRTMVAGLNGLSFATAVVSAYQLTNGNTEIECEGEVGLTKIPSIQYQAEFSRNELTSYEVGNFNFFDNVDWIDLCKESCKLESYTHFGFECVQKDEDLIKCICGKDPQGQLEGNLSDPGNLEISECSDTQYMDGFFLGDSGSDAKMYRVDPETSTVSPSSLRVLQESETESEEFGFSISIRIQNEVDDLGRLQDLAAPGADPKVWTIADLVAGFATAAAMAMAAI